MSTATQPQSEPNVSIPLRLPFLYPCASVFLNIRATFLCAFFSVVVDFFFYRYFFWLCKVKFLLRWRQKKDISEDYFANFNTEFVIRLTTPNALSYFKEFLTQILLVLDHSRMRWRRFRVEESTLVSWRRWCFRVEQLNRFSILKTWVFSKATSHWNRYSETLFSSKWNFWELWNFIKNLKHSWAS